MFSFCIGFKGWHLDHLERCLYWIERLRTEDDEIIVCDLGSRVDTVREVLALVQPHWGTRSGKLFVSAWAADWSRAEALNRAAAQARQPWLVFVDADMLLPTCWIPAITADIFADPESPVRLTRSRDLPDFGPHPFPIPGVLDDAWLHAMTTEHPETGQGAATVARRDWFIRVGGFDETYRTWGAEDSDLALRAEWGTGHPIRWVSGAWAAHQWHSRAWGNTPEIAAQVRKNREYLAARIAERGPIVRNQHLTRGSHGDHTAR